VDYEAQLVANLSLVDRVVRSVARRYWLSSDETDDLGGDVRLKLVENDYEVLRKFEGRSSLQTYLMTVVLRHFLDQRNAQWGKWRPSVLARKLGPIAILLDQLLTRDCLSFEEAAQTIIARYGNAASREELHAIMLQLPMRSPRRFVDDEGIEDIAEPDSGEDAVIASLDRRRLGDKIERALTVVLERLGDEDRVIIKLRFCEKVQLARIAELLSLPAKPFYKRVDELMAQLRTELEAQGISQTDVEAIMGDPGTALGDVIQRILAGKQGGRPS
jgi:RNA polymerase sigma factor for flagellar operon FliA